MTQYKDAGTLQDEIEQVLGREVDGVTVDHISGEISVTGVDDAELEEIAANVDPEASDATGRFRRANDTRGPGAGEGRGGDVAGQNGQGQGGR